MSDKAKHKVNPRRRTLIQMIIIILMIGLSLTSSAQESEDAQIVFIAPDDSGIDQIWLVDLNNPDSPRQMTSIEENFGMGDYTLISQRNSILLYILISKENFQKDWWYLNLETGQNKFLIPCSEKLGCYDLSLHANGHWIAYQTYVENSEDDSISINVMIQNLDSSEERLVYEFSHSENLLYHHFPQPQWVGNTDTLIFRIAGDAEHLEQDEFAFYSLAEDRIVAREQLHIPYRYAYFNDDGSKFAYFSNFIGDGVQPRYIRTLDDVDTLLYQTGDHEFMYDWHPDGERILVGCVTYACNPKQGGHVLRLDNTVNGEIQHLVTGHDISYADISFNADASLILYRKWSTFSAIGQLFIFDMNTREEIVLPLSGREPQWVNGGR